MFNIISFLYFSYLAVRLFAARKQAHGLSFVALLMLYIGLMDICNTNGILSNGGLAIFTLSIAIKLVMIFAANYMLFRAKESAKAKSRNKIVRLSGEKNYHREGYRAA